MTALPDALRPRERILLAARELFHRHGIRGVGVETIAEAAGTNKMTLYRHFDSKDELIIAYLRGVAVEVDEMWRDFERDHPGDMQAQLKAWLICAEECVTSDERGCDLANAAVELTADDHPGRRIIEELKTEHRNRLASLCRRAGISQPEVLADTLTLLLEGARVSRQAECEIHRDRGGCDRDVQGKAKGPPQIALGRRRPRLAIAITCQIADAISPTLMSLAT
jgi:AcrR family transcriptional regulator